MPNTQEQLFQNLARMVGPFKIEVLIIEGLTHNGPLSARVACATRELFADSWAQPDGLGILCSSCSWNNVQLMSATHVVMAETILQKRESFMNWLQEPDPTLNHTTQAVKWFDDHMSVFLDNATLKEQMFQHLRHALRGQTGRDMEEEAVQKALFPYKAVHQAYTNASMTSALDMLDGLESSIRADIGQRIERMVIIKNLSGMQHVYQLLMLAQKVAPDIYIVPQALFVLLALEYNLGDDGLQESAYILAPSDYNLIKEVLAVYDESGGLNTLEKAFDAVKAL